jgi:AcrR family transcriptional regulator
MDTPARGTRPRNRRALTLDAATELFYRRGYAHVAMSDIAAATNVGASAIYRHFPGKSDILVAAIESGLAPYAEILRDAAASDASPAATLEALLPRLAACALDHRELGVLWQREARNLDDASQRAMREQLRATTGVLADLVGGARPELDRADSDLLAWCALGVLVSVGFHSLTLPRREFVELLVTMVKTVLAMPMPDVSGVTETQTRPAGWETSRRETLISEATELFAERGYAAVGVDEIADAVGIAGPSIYSHFASKQTILVEAIQRGSRLLHDDAARILASDSTSQQKLATLVDSYVRLANRERFIIRTLLAEMEQLPPEDREIVRSDQRRYIDTWVDLLRELTGADATAARIRVQAVLLMVNDAVQTPHLRERPGFELTLRTIADALLDGGSAA